MPADSNHSEDTKVEDTKKVLAKVSIKSQPKVLIELNRLARSEDVSFDVVSDLIGQDVGLSAKLLKLASSPIYSKGQKFASVHDALMAIGFEEFKTCFTSVTLTDLLGKIGYPYGGFWEHSRLVGRLAKEVAELLARPLSSAAYTLGLFHDVGAVLIPLYNRDYVEHIHRTLPLYFGITELEFKMVKTNHCAVGEMFGQNWGLDEDLLQALRYHHRPDLNALKTKKAKSLKCILQLAELFNDKAQSSSDVLTPFTASKDTLASICEWFDLKPQDVSKIEAEAMAAVQKSEA
jgi:HD-like signal output (HDOD) protein